MVPFNFLMISPLNLTRFTRLLYSDTPDKSFVFILRMENIKDMEVSFETPVTEV